ncbi:MULTISPECIES: DUF1453 domain-containing protein [unclassified Streptomyces]|uniref:DUF1453 domain-containing protein n=1 Tax=unclassified Streptomyces TaxID=2593676 RepID=UPI0022547E56|nr:MULTISPECIES: DUF1453 domain-containing protein [unclassified Streptomyces]MCX5143408.1 DUF1453 domain-containing protein [Streptomyces sp. NBC_00338]WSU61813.1 DUF1453 domain-containing protein [Streptomyces sp. NBC_01104]
MSGLVNLLVIVAVIGFVVVRQCSAQQISGDRRWWVLPGVLLVMALREPGLVDPRHEALSVIVLGAELAVGLVTGAGWGWTARLWRAEDGTLWSKGTKATVYVWTGGLILRAALYGLAAALGIHQGGPALMMALAVTLLVRSGVLARRAGEIPRSYRGPGDGGPAGRRSAGRVPFRPAGKDRV